MMALPHRPKMSVEEYLQLDRNSEARYEFIDGHRQRITTWHKQVNSRTNPKPDKGRREDAMAVHLAWKAMTKTC